jgi:hypothetical protein
MESQSRQEKPLWLLAALSIPGSLHLETIARSDFDYLDEPCAGRDCNYHKSTTPVHAHMIRLMISGNVRKTSLQAEAQPTASMFSCVCLRYSR